MAPADTEALRARWPDVLDAVQVKRRVARIQLSNASVESFADGVLTLAFAQAGFARGFQTGGYDKDLGDVLAAMFGITPQIRTTVLAGGAAGSGSDQDLGIGTGSSGPAAPAQTRSSGPRPEPDPGDMPAPDSLTGMDLVQRELGGRVIEETGGT